MRAMRRWIPIALGLLLLAGCKSKVAPLSYELVATHPHDAGCYTQGLEFADGLLLESGGGYGESVLRRVDPGTGEVLQERWLPATVFAEGLTLLNGELWLLTWKEGKAYVFDPESFELLRTHTYEGEGWGLTHDGTHLVMSNGSAVLQWRNPKDFSLVRELKVTRGGRQQDQLNELEYVDGMILANIYEKDEVVRIDADSGKVTGVIDLSELRKKLDPPGGEAEVLNGIARHPDTGNYWITGKYWPQVFEVRMK